MARRRAAPVATKADEPVNHMAEDIAEATTEPAQNGTENSVIERPKRAIFEESFSALIQENPEDRSQNKMVRVTKDYRNKVTAITFDVNPNEGRTKEEVEAILKPIREAGFRWGRIQGEKAWTKPWDNGGRFSYAVHLEGQRAAEAAAKIMNPQQQQEQSIPL